MKPDDRKQALDQISRLAGIMETLRGPGGCPWDRAQNFASIAPYTIEEAYEVADSISLNDMQGLCEELGDLLLQVVFHAQIAAEAEHFTLADVARGIGDKMERRHPHIFGATAGPATATDVRATWEQIKAAEKQRESVLDGIAAALPALTRAEKLANRAARTGFDWPDAAGPLAKIHEELSEIAAAVSDEARLEEAGDMLFAAANYVRKLGLDPEEALRRANRKFEQRFKFIEKNPGFVDLSLDDKERLWQSTKRGPAA